MLRRRCRRCPGPPQVRRLQHRRHRHFISHVYSLAAAVLTRTARPGSTASIQVRRSDGCRSCNVRSCRGPMRSARKGLVRVIRVLRPFAPSPLRRLPHYYGGSRLHGDPGRGLAGGVEPGKAYSAGRPGRPVDTARIICYYSCFRLERERCAFVIPFAGTWRYAVTPNRRNGHQRRRRRP
jgi:hypothetical protein